MSSSATIVNDCENGDRVQQQSSRTSGVPVAPSKATTTQASGTHRGNRERSRGTTSLARADGQPSSEANASPTRSRRTAPRQVIDDDIIPAERAISESPLVRDRVQKQSSSASGVPVPPSSTTTTQASGRLQAYRKRSRPSTSLARADRQPSSSEANANPIMSRRTTPRLIEDDINPAERAILESPLVRDCVQQQSSRTSGVPVAPSNAMTTQASGRHKENKERSRGNTSLARADGQPSSEANANPTRSRRTDPRKVIDDDIIPAESAISESPLVRNCVQKQSSSTSGVPVAPSSTTTTQDSGRLQADRKRSRPGTSLARADGQPSSSEANANNTRSRRTTPRRVIEDDITPAERAILESLLVRDCVPQQSSRTSGVPVAPSNAMTTQASGRHKENKERSCGNTSLERADGQPSSEANANPTRSRSTAPRQVIDDDIIPAEKAISESPLVRNCVQKQSSSTSGVPVAPSSTTTTQASGRLQADRKRSRLSTSLARADGQPSSSEANANPTRSRRTTPRRVIEDDINPAERAILESPLVRGCVQQQSSRTSGVPVAPSNAVTTQASGRHKENRERSCGNTSLARADRQPSSEANANPTRSRRTAPRQVIDDDIIPAERAISESPLVRNCVQKQFSSTSGVPVAPSSTTTTQASGRLQVDRKRSRPSTNLARAYGQPSSSEANANPTRSRRTTPRRVIEDDITPAERAILESPLVRDCVQQQSSRTSGVPVAPSNAMTTQASGRHKENRERSHGKTSLARADGQPSSEANANPTRSWRTARRWVIEDDIIPAERSISESPLVRDCVQQQSSSTSGVPVAPSNTMTTQASGRLQRNRKRSRGSTSLARAGGQPSSSEANANSTVSRRTTPRWVIEDDIIPAERAISESRLVRGASNGPLPPRGIRQGSRSISRRNTSSSRTYESPGSSSARADEEPDINSETADTEPGSSDAWVAEDYLTPAERNISGTQLLRNLGDHPSVYARVGLNPPTQGLSFRGAWKRAVNLYRVANDQYKQLFIDAGFGDFLKIDPVELPQGYLIALTERWFAETNTLHLPCCELGPTPLDWTMITGLRFGGQPIKLNRKYGKEKVRKLLGVGGKKIFSGTRICLSAIKPRKELVEAVPPTNEARERIFRRLFLYVIGSCFFGNNQSVIHYELLEFLEDIYTVGRYDWGAITYAAFLAGMRRKVTGQIGSFTAFWQFLLFWAFEYLNICRPEHAEVNDFPRATRWKFPQNLGTLDNSELTASRCQLDYVDDETKVTWQPYLASEEYNSGAINNSIRLAKSRVPFIGFDTWEYYLGERCQRQLGLPCLVPSDPPETMHGESKDYPYDDTSMVSSAQNLVSDESVDYASWFAENSIGKIVDVTRLIGGTDIGRKVISHWTAKHRPGMILVPESEVEEIKQARDTADAEYETLREELSRVRRGSDS